MAACTEGIRVREIRHYENHRADYQIRMRPEDQFQPGAFLRFYAADRPGGHVLHVNRQHGVMVLHVHGVSMGRDHVLPPEIRVLQLLAPEMLGNPDEQETVIWGVVELISWPLETRHGLHFGPRERRKKRDGESQAGAL